MDIAYARASKQARRLTKNPSIAFGLRMRSAGRLGRRGRRAPGLRPHGGSGARGAPRLLQRGSAA